MYLQSHIYKNYSSKVWFYNYLKSRSVFVFTLYIKPILFEYEIEIRTFSETFFLCQKKHVYFNYIYDIWVTFWYDICKEKQIIFVTYCSM